MEKCVVYRQFSDNAEIFIFAILIKYYDGILAYGKCVDLNDWIFFFLNVFMVMMTAGKYLRVRINRSL